MKGLSRAVPAVIVMIGMLIPTISAAEKPLLVVAKTAHATATVVAINKKQREITLRNQNGSEFTVIATDQVRNFSQIKAGDVVELEYRMAVASALEKGNSTVLTGQVTGATRAPEGAKPGGVISHSRSLVATVLAIDHQNRLLTAKGPKGTVLTVQVPPELKAFDSLKPGDRIAAVHSEALAVSVRTPRKK